MTPFRRIINHLTAIGAGSLAIVSLERTAGPVPPLVAFLCGIVVTLTSLAHVQARTGRSDDPSTEDYRGRHRGPSTERGSGHVRFTARDAGIPVVSLKST